MADAPAIYHPKALLLIESNVDDAFLFSRALKASQIDCDFYSVPSVEAATRYLIAAATDFECLPAVIVISPSLGIPEATELNVWIRSCDHLRGCTVVGLAADGGGLPDGRESLRKPVTATRLREVLSQRFAPIPLAAV